MNVSGGYKVSTSKGSASKCAAGTYKAAHTLTYGETSSCSNCSAGTYSAEGAASCTNCSSDQYSNEGSSSCFSKCSSVTLTQTTTCSKSCGGGKYKREAYSAYDSTYRCPASDDWNGASCNTMTCCSSVNSEYTWGSWYYTGNCTKSCGGGTRAKRRDGTKYSAIDEKTVCETTYQTGSDACNTTSCCAETTSQYWYTSYGNCSASCGSGTQSKTCHYHEVSTITGENCYQDWARSCGSQSCTGNNCTGSCFLKGTKVKTIFGYKDIDKINKGDVVLSYNEATGKNEYKEVIEKLVHIDYNERIYTLLIEGKELQVTQDHRFYIKVGNSYDWVSASDLRVGDYVRYSNGTFHKIDSISYKTQTNTVYNLTVKDNHNYYVGEDEILVHNKKVGGCFLPGTKVRTMFGYKDIDKVELGDYVLSYNENSKTNQFKKVTYKFVFDDLEEELYTLTFDDNSTMDVTQHHNVYIYRNNEFKHLAAKDLEVNDQVVYSNGDRHSIVNITHRTINEPVYNIEVADSHTYYVYENEVLVHNMRHLFGAVNEKF